MNNDKKFMRLALEEAETCLEDKILTVGAVLVVNGDVVGKSRKTMNHSYHTDHAETVLLRNYFKGKNVRRSDQHIALYTTLEPCIMCLGLILHLPINRLVYAASDPYGGACCIVCNKEHLPYRHQKESLEVVEGICELEAKEQLRRFLAVNEHKFYKDESNLLVRYILS